MKTIESLFIRLVKAMNAIAAVGLFVIMVVVVLNVLMRALLNMPFMGTYEVVQYGLLLAVSLALADNELNDGNVMVSFFLEKMKPKMANLFSIAMYVLAVVGIGVVTYNQAQMVVTKFYNKAASAILALPHWIIVLVLTLGFFTLFLTVLLKLIRMIANHKHLSDHKLTDEERLTQTGNPAGNNF